MAYIVRDQATLVGMAAGQTISTSALEVTLNSLASQGYTLIAIAPQSDDNIGGSWYIFSQ